MLFRYQRCPKKGGRFVNPFQENVRRTLKAALDWKFGKYDDPLEHNELPPPDFKHPLEEIFLEKEKPHAVWINHSTYFISNLGINGLTDPIWSNRCSPLQFLGPKRRHAPGWELDNLPEIHFVLISHDHYDHLDEWTVKELYKRFPKITWFVPEGVKKWFLKRGITNVVEKHWWEEAHLQFGETHLWFTCVPAQHFSGRTATAFNKTLWAGWVVEYFQNNALQRRLYFVGDTGYNHHHFKEIHSKFHYMDLSLIPIGAYIPRQFMAPVHIDPLSAVKIHEEVRSRFSLGMHWKTFNLADEPHHQPPYDLFKALKTRNIEKSQFLALDPGEGVNW